jgi:hypothetical protein
MRRLFPLLALLVSCPFQPAAGADVPDTTSTRMVRRATTDSSYLTPLVVPIPDSDDVPSPRDFLGYPVGTPGRLTSHRDILRYFRALDDASERLSLYSMGTSQEGREMFAAVIADQATQADLERYRRILARLADPREVTPEEAEGLIASGKPVYFVTGGLHSTECGPPEMAMELAYRMAVSEQQPVRSIRENVILLLCPVLEADGRERMVDWYNRYLSDNEDWEDSPPRSPPYWGHYTFHDNNRDGIQISQPLTRNYYRTFFDWHPTVSLDLHESIPLLYVSTGTGPYNPRVDPVTVGEWQWFSSFEVAELARYGLPGVWTWGFYTGWYPGYLLWITINHNALGRFYETFGNAGANTFERKLEETTFAGRKITSREWYRPWPPGKKIQWSLRDNTNYMETGVLTSLSLAAEHGQTLLRNFWRKGVNSLERGRTEPPYAWLVPADQDDPARVARLVNLLRDHGIEVHRCDEAIHAEDREFPPGTFVVRMDQPYRDFAQNLLEKQDFPTDVEHRPYDDVAWTLGYVLGVETVPLGKKEPLEVPMTRVEEPVSFPGSVEGAEGARFFLLEHHGQKDLLSLRFALADHEIDALAGTTTVAGSERPPGSWIVPVPRNAGRLVRDLKEAASRWGGRFVGVDEDLPADRIELDLPRIAVYHSWRYTQDSGWLRYTFDRAEIPYTLINKDHVRRGDLRKSFDVLLLPSQAWLSGRSLLQGIDPRWGPMPYTRTDEFPSHGRIDSSPDITGGLGYEGMENLRRFLDDGGVLMALGSGGLLPVEMGLVRDVRVARSGRLRCPGSVVSTRVLDRDSPIAFGYPTVGHVFRTNVPLFTVPDRMDSVVVMKFGAEEKKEEDGDEAGEVNAGESPDGKSGEAASSGGESKKEAKEETPPLCLSGAVFGESDLKGKPAVLDLRAGEGRVILYAFNPMHRYLNHADFGLLYNAILTYNDGPGAR